MNTLTAFFVIVSLLLAACRQPRPAVIAAADSLVDRVRLDHTFGADLPSARDHVWVANRLYVLDWTNRRVAQLERRTKEFHIDRIFGRRGRGPGELDDPIALAYNDSTAFLEILERSGTIEVFDTAGRYIETDRITLPCEPAYAQFTIVKRQRLVGQRCVGTRGLSLHPDSFYIILARVSRDRAPELLGSQATSSIQSPSLSLFSARWPFAAAGDSVLFGAGITNCFFRGPLWGVSKAAMTCDGAVTRYRSPPPPNWEKRFSWPNPLPLFVGVTYARTVPVLIRLVSADSLLFETADARHRPLLVAPFDPFIGCNANSCLWFDDNTGKMSLVDLRLL